MKPRPATVLLPSPHLPDADWADRFELALNGKGLTAIEVAERSLGNSPAWVRTLLKLRNRVVSVVGLKSEAPSPGKFGLIGPFPVLSRSDDEVVLGFNDAHLDFRIVVDVRAGSAVNQIIGMTTLIRRHNTLGRVYLAAVMPFHKVIVPTLLAGAASPPG
ncbi:DUF2867 domain-containing protein [Ensifer sp. T173]|uniref:DUF2867 domain-containing protein n=1 Tax=Ensifer canadensis TaxID=555315 RepID=A0AAW4FPA4_9HYPH|nr:MULTISPECIES: DUF2867 domain-containing protein [Ensifer]MDP9631823.1 hypothetical protein [Ensifer adhaerens]KQW56333.1 hypothetical protein ASD03_17410 [Ensifer sp. Root127]MBD9488992.1 DUF2867 domain-containing protein [Ensifer sp. ENS11]MBM3093137.1 DUF2867 domain-containing protein [Ensifer canadensis]NOV18246.1 DUF2867 domain-containing protein [Ensifer canadensis]